MWGRDVLKRLKDNGTIRDYREEPMAISQPVRKEILWIELNLQNWCNENGLELVKEYRFMISRKYRFDFAAPAIKLAVEYEGIMSVKSRHTSITGFSNDTTKYNHAAIEGWRVLRYTAITYLNLIEDLKNIKINGVTGLDWR